VNPFITIIGAVISNAPAEVQAIESFLAAIEHLTVLARQVQGKTGAAPVVLTAEAALAKVAPTITGAAAAAQAIGL
jgi:nitrate reductase NapAB chaperone NapD